MDTNLAADLGNRTLEEVRAASRWRFRYLGAAVFLTGWGLFGTLGGNEGYTDALFEPDFTIRWVPADGPLAEAGFQAGDSVISVEGIPVVELGMYSRWPRSLSRAPGESITMVVEREGEMVPGEVIYRERPPGVRRFQLIAALFALSILFSGIWILFAAPSAHAVRLATMGLAAGLVLPGPSLGSWNGVGDHLQLAGMALLLLLLLRFFLFFPRQKRIGTGRSASMITYAAWGIILGSQATELLFHPRYYHSFGPLWSLLMLSYLVATLAALLHTVVKTPGSEMRASGMGLVLGGFGVGLGGFLLWLALVLLPGISIPGSNLLLLLLTVIPVGMALGVRKNVRGPQPE